MLSLKLHCDQFLLSTRRDYPPGFDWVLKDFFRKEIFLYANNIYW